MKKLMSMLAAGALVAASPAMAAWDGDLTAADVDAVLTFLGSPAVDAEVDEGDDIEGDGAWDDLEELEDVLGSPGAAAAVSAIVNADEGIPEIAEWLFQAAVISGQTAGDTEYDIYGANYAAIEANLATTLFAGQEAAIDLVAILCTKNAVAGALYIDAQGVGTTLATLLPVPLGGNGTLLEAESVSASGDFDGDGFTNLEEWENAAATMNVSAKALTFSAADGSYKLLVNHWISAAQDPGSDGSVPVIDIPGGAPVAGGLGLGLLSLAVAAGGALAVRRK